MTQDTDEDLDLTGSIIDPSGFELLSVHEIRTSIDTTLGETVGDEFMRLAVYSQIPQNPSILETFLIGRKDLISKECLQRLREGKERCLQQF